MSRADPSTRLPIKIDCTSNGEYPPIPVGERKRVGYREDPDPLFLTYGPKTRREFLNLLSWKGGKLGD